MCSDHGSWQCQNRNENVRIYCLEKLYVSICAKEASIRYQKSCRWGGKTEKCNFFTVWRSLTKKIFRESGAGDIRTWGEIIYQGVFLGGSVERELCAANQVFSGLCTLQIMLPRWSGRQECSARRKGTVRSTCAQIERWKKGKLIKSLLKKLRWNALLSLIKFLA